MLPLCHCHLLRTGLTLVWATFSLFFFSSSPNLAPFHQTPHTASTPTAYPCLHHQSLFLGSLSCSLTSLSARICWSHPCRSRLSSWALRIVTMPPPSPPFRPLLLATPSLSAHGSVPPGLLAGCQLVHGGHLWSMCRSLVDEGCVCYSMAFFMTAMVWHLSEPNLDSTHTHRYNLYVSLRPIAAIPNCTHVAAASTEYPSPASGF